MAVRPERLAINPSLRNSINRLISVEAEQLRNDGGRSNFDQNYMIQAYSIEGVQESNTTLNFVRFDHSLQEVTNGQLLPLSR